MTSPQIDRLAAALAETGAEVVRSGPATLAIKGLDAAAVGHAAFTAGVELHELRTERADLERLFFSLTQGEFAAPPPGGPLRPDGYVSGQVPPPGRVPVGPPPGQVPSGPQQKPGGAL